MSSPLRDLFAGLVSRRPAYLATEPRWTFEHVILPDSTRRALSEALGQIHQHDLIFRQWGLGERHTSGLGLAFNFAGPPGTGKSICAEAIAHRLGRSLLVVRYAELESMWAGETAKNVRAVFEAAQEQNAVLFFDEADAIAGRRGSSVNEAYTREANLVVNVLLQELEAFNGVIIFATNVARNFDPAFERRIRTHIYFELPGVDEREQIWRAQLHKSKTPVADDVDFHALAVRYERSGGDIKNAVLKAALAAADQSGPDNKKEIRQEHFERAMDDVVGARRVLQQSVLDDRNTPEAVFARLEQQQQEQRQAVEQGLRETLRPLRLAIALGALAVAIAILALFVALL
jgi:SpoVK/Ycf46/Vps4 family AAA+-type ATPase